MSDSFIAAYAHPLAEQIRAARDQGDECAERLVLEQLLNAYARLGNRELGTVDEQNEYIVARHLGALPEAMRELGLTPDDVPMPPGRRRPPPPPQAPAVEDAARIGDRFAHLGPDDDEPEDRFTVDVRTQDGMRYEGRAAPFAIVDTHDGLPVAWYTERHVAESMANTANLLRNTD
ncbi:hypothetical protein ACWD7T_32955 [Streptomyces sp. 900116325]